MFNLRVPSGWFKNCIYVLITNKIETNYCIDCHEFALRTYLTDAYDAFVAVTYSDDSLLAVPVGATMGRGRYV